MKNYKGKTFIITGAAGEIGSSICRHFAHEGLRFYLLDLESQLVKCNELAGELMNMGAQHAEGMVMDVTNPEQIKEVITKIGEEEKYIDILVNNAGYGNTNSITNEGTIEIFRKMMAVNVEGPWMITQAALPYLGRPVKKPPKKNKDQREGQLIYIESSAGKVGVPYMASYVATKHALVGIADVVRMEMKIKNEKIQVISICPAPAKTKFWDKTKDMRGFMNNYEQKGFLYSAITADDVGKAVYRASRGNKNEVMVPRWWYLLPFIRSLSIGFTDKLLVNIGK
ncbi:MAG: SDR family NAD(P)-dependent oxidoreductase [Candidatus Lokiarchaeota archaeon]|nr:SDR family NAD(P)-dependent oxidoreductase [Candidatus Lokiarchaeota archaeon]